MNREEIEPTPLEFGKRYSQVFVVPKHQHRLLDHLIARTVLALFGKNSWRIPLDDYVQVYISVEIKPWQ